VFTIAPQTGQITVADPAGLDYDSVRQFVLTVQVTDSGGLSDSAAVTIHVLDANRPPQIHAQTFHVDENVPHGTLAGTVAASDPDPNDVLTYWITAGNVGGTFAIGGLTGQLTVNTPPGLDFETRAEFTLTDPGDTQIYSIIAGNEVGAFSIAADTREITVNVPPVVDYEWIAQFVLTVRVVDSADAADYGMITILVRDLNEAPIVAAALADQQAWTNQLFTFTFDADTFQDPDFGDVLTFAATGASGTLLPGWLSFAPATRTFSGTPGTSDAGSFPIAVTARDSGGLEVTDTFRQADRALTSDASVWNTMSSPLPTFAAVAAARSVEAAVSPQLPNTRPPLVSSAPETRLGFSADWELRRGREVLGPLRDETGPDFAPHWLDDILADIALEVADTWRHT
jgi:hypothetical protein